MTDRPAGSPVVPIPTKVCVYTSRAAPGLTLDDVRALMFQARDFNAINGITGLLTYDRRGFLQVIEGTVDAVDELLAAISRDTRHRDLQIVLDAPVFAPQFLSFNDLIFAGERLARLSTLPCTTLARLSGDVAGALGLGYTRLAP